MCISSLQWYISVGLVKCCNYAWPIKSKSIPLSQKHTCCHDCCTSLWRWDLILSNCVRLFYMHWAFQHINEGQWKRCLIIDRSLVCEQKQKTLTELHRHWACEPFRTQLRISVKFDSILDFKFSQQIECHLIFWIGIQRIVKSCHHVLIIMSFWTIWISISVEHKRHSEDIAACNYNEWELKLSSFKKDIKAE